MTATPTNAAFLSAINSMSVTGVTKSYGYPPSKLDTGDLPAKFPMMMSAGQGELVSTCTSLSKTRSIELVICIEPVAQDVQSLNYAKIAPLVDALETALDALTVANFIAYEISTTGAYAIGNINYWAIVANITASSA